MPHLPDLADRIWFAIHCLPRDKRGNPPSFRQLEEENGLSHSALSKAVLGKSQLKWGETRRAFSAALRVSEPWLEFGAGESPTPTGAVPPRPGISWVRYGDLRGWSEAVRIALRDPQLKIPPAAFLAGAELPAYRMVERLTPEFVAAAAAFAWESSTVAEQTKYSTLEGSRASAGDSSPKLRAARRPVAK